MKEIELSQGKTALVDDADFKWLSQWKWTAARDHHGWWSAYRKEGTKTVGMHRQILDAKPGQRVNHKNNDGLDNRRENLRFATFSQSRAHRDKSETSHTVYKGVYPEGNQWVVRIGEARQYVGIYETPELAAEAYNRAAIELYGEFAKLIPIKVTP